MHIARISAPLLCLVWHFIVNIGTVIIAFNTFESTNTLLKKVFVAFSIVSVVVYAAIAGPLFVYSYKYGSSPGNRNGRLLSGISLMFLFSSIPMEVTMIIIILQKVLLKQYTLFIISYSLHSVAFAVGLFISWFAYMRAVAAAFHRWRGPERQIPPQGNGSAGIMATTCTVPIRKDYPDFI